MPFIWNRLNYVLYGVFWTVGLYGFLKDYLGQEAYIQYCRDHWFHMSPWWGFGVATLSVYAIWSHLKFEMKETRALTERMTNLIHSAFKKEKSHE